MRTSAPPPSSLPSGRDVRGPARPLAQAGGVHGFVLLQQIFPLLLSKVGPPHAEPRAASRAGFRAGRARLLLPLVLVRDQEGEGEHGTRGRRRELGIPTSYTLEASFCGAAMPVAETTQTTFYHFNTSHLMRIGASSARRSRTTLGSGYPGSARSRRHRRAHLAVPHAPLCCLPRRPAQARPQRPRSAEPALRSPPRGQAQRRHRFNRRRKQRGRGRASRGSGGASGAGGAAGGGTHRSEATLTGIGRWRPVG